MNKHIGIFILVVTLILGILGIFVLSQRNNNMGNNQDTKRQVITSFYPLYFFSTQIGGDKASVVNITPAGIEPHEYEPTAQDLARIERSDMIVLNGGIEGWVDSIQNNLKEHAIKIVIAGEGLFSNELKEGNDSIQDPHVWLDPQLAKKEVQKITDGYISIDPTNAAYYQKNQVQLTSKLDQLDNMFQVGLQNCQRRDIVTSHAAFGYLAARYALNQVSVSGISPDEEPSAQQLAEVAKFARENNITYIFFESLVSPKLAETVAEEIGAQTLVLDPLEGISDDDSAQGKNYFTVMEENLKNLRIALQCT